MQIPKPHTTAPLAEPPDSSCFYLYLFIYFYLFVHGFTILWGIFTQLVVGWARGLKEVSKEVADAVREESKVHFEKLRRHEEPFHSVLWYYRKKELPKVAHQLPTDIQD